MKIILDISTLLGGLAALWFFWERYLSFRSTPNKRLNITTARPSTNLQPSIPSFNKNFMSASLGAGGGMIAGIVAMKFGYESTSCLFFPAIIAGFVSSETRKQNVSKVSAHIVGLSFAFMALWSFISVFLHYAEALHLFSFPKILFLLLGGLLGAMYVPWALADMLRYER